MLRVFFGNLIFAIIALMLCGIHLKVKFLNLSLLNFLVESVAIADDDLFSTVRGSKRGSINDLVNRKKRKTDTGINYQRS